MAFLLWWREILIALLVVVCLWLINKNQDLGFKAKEIQLTHEKLVLEAKANSANVVATAQRQRQIDAEKYASEVNNLNIRYADALSKSNRVYEKVTTYNNRLHTVTRETVENYAKTGSLLYNECRKEYLDLGHYTAKLDAELDKVTDSSVKPK